MYLFGKFNHKNIHLIPSNITTCLPAMSLTWSLFNTNYYIKSVLCWIVIIYSVYLSLNFTEVLRSYITGKFDHKNFHLNLSNITIYFLPTHLYGANIISYLFSYSRNNRVIIVIFQTRGPQWWLAIDYS